MKHISGLLFFLLTSIFVTAQQKTVVLTFDDAIASHCSVAGPALKQYGFGATFYVCEFPPDFADSSKYLNWRQIKSLADDGFEIGNHTWHHTGVNDISLSTLDTEITYIENKCISLRIPKPVSFAYPGCPPSKAAAELLRKRGYSSARTCEAKAYIPGRDDAFFLPSYAIGGTDTTVFYNALKNQKDGGIVVFLFHGVPDHAHEWVNTPEAVFLKYMDYLHRNKYRVIAMRDVFASQH